MEYKRIMLKVSGEALGGDAGLGLDMGALRRMAAECVDCVKRGKELAVVVGGGNFLRGGKLADSGIQRVTGDQMGMLATVINGMALRDMIETKGGKAVVFSAMEVKAAAMPFSRRRCLKRMSDGCVAILTGGTGNPFFTTDTAAALRASELGADVFMKATKVDGVYDDDPKKNTQARRYDKLSYMEVIQQSLGVMDITAVTLCRENAIPILVFDMTREGNVSRVLEDQSLGTLIS
ncbi:MAG: UMP kinase [Planctomycetota bacterium]|jgi:uridylate kinase